MARPTRGIGDKWIDVCRLLNRRGAAYIVVGGIAVNLHGHVRATRDLDILVPRDIENTRRILEALADLPYGMARELDAETVDARPITIIGDDPRVVAERGASQSMAIASWRSARLRNASATSLECAA